MKKYVLCFVFNSTFTKVLLMTKQRPEEQKDHANGIGGKVEPGEEIVFSMQRELLEEAGVKVGIMNFTYCGRFYSPDKWEVFTFAIADEVVFQGARTQTDEPIHQYHVNELHKFQTNANVPALVLLCKNRLERPRQANQQVVEFDIRFE